MFIQTIVALMVATGTQAPTEEKVSLKTDNGVLHGTLMLPAGTNAGIPVALIIAGSGPTDRDGNTPLLPGKNNSLRLIAEALAERGIASLRYDKRGIAESAASMTGKSEADLRFTDFVDDAAGWLKQLEADARFSSRFVIGHSEGSLIGILAAQHAHVQGVVSLAGAGRPIAEILTEQLERNLPPDLKPVSANILKELQAGRTVADVPAALAMIYRPSVQPYLISWLPIDPAAEVGRLHVPVLVLQGNTDIQAMVADAERLSHGHARAQLVIIDGMNHVLKEVREAAAQMASYSDPALPLHPQLAPALGDFIKRTSAR